MSDTFREAAPNAATTLMRMLAKIATPRIRPSKQLSYIRPASFPPNAVPGHRIERGGPGIAASVLGCPRCAIVPSLSCGYVLSSEFGWNCRSSQAMS